MQEALKVSIMKLDLLNGQPSCFDKMIGLQPVYIDPGGIILDIKHSCMNARSERFINRRFEPPPGERMQTDPDAVIRGKRKPYRRCCSARIGKILMENKKLRRHNRNRRLD